MKFLIICTKTKQNYIFRKKLITLLLSKGNDVLVHAMDDEYKYQFDELGCSFCCFKSSNRSTNPFEIQRYKNDLKRTIKTYGPDYILTFQAKPNIYGCLAAKSAEFKGKVVSMVEGVGDPFTKTGFKWSIIRNVFTYLYKKSLPRANAVYFLNKDNIELFKDLKIVTDSQVSLLPSIGVDTTFFKPFKTNNSKMIVGTACRLIKTKGVFEFCEIARKCHQQNKQIEFVIAGEEAEITKENLLSYIENGDIKYLGRLDDMLSFYNSISIYLSCSYKEGFPVTIMESMACGNMIVASDVTGNNSAINSDNGILYPLGDVDKASEIILSLNQDMIRQYGLKARKYAEDNFNDELIQNMYINEILTEK